MTRKIRWKLLLGLVLIVLLLGGGGYGFVVWKNKRTASTLLEQAQRAEDEERYADAAGLLANYLAYRPKDNEQRTRMGLLLEQAGTLESKAQAISVFARVLRSDPTRDDLRRRLVDLAMGLDRF